MQRRKLLAAVPSLLTSGVLSGLIRPVYAQTAQIRFGQSASITGGQAAYGKDIRDGINAAFAAANKAGSAKSGRFELVTLDDGGDQTRCVQNTKTLIDSGVSALLGFTSGAGAEAALPQIEESQIVLLGTASGNMGIRRKELNMPYHVRAGSDDEYVKLVAFIKDFGMKKVAYVYLKDVSNANLAAMENAMKAAGIAPAIAIALDRNAKSFDADAAKLLAADVEGILFTTNAQPIVRITDYLAKNGFTGFSFCTSFAGQALIDTLSSKRRSIIMSQVVLRPKTIGSSLIKHYQEHIAALGGGARTGYTSLEGYIAGMVAIEAAQLALKGEDGVSRSRFKKAISALNVDLGGYRVNFASGGHHGSHFSEVLAVDKTGRIIG
ncbi:ABC transporter substrate-binding protein [Undibacterium sp. RuTC16W]|uniref:ABC transporter substrate-binding protein n=1 Tax=Undibacterium sp. RuTC16W TaxID=3413048 RepID=UPI003BEFE58C